MELPIHQLKLVRYKKMFPDLSDKDFYALKESIEKWGIIQPIVINQNHVIICGKERYRAALLLGIKKVPVVIRKTNENNEIENISLEENLKRRHLTLSKEAKEVTALYGFKIKGTEEREGKKRNYSILKKSETKQRNVSKRHISRYHTAKLIPELRTLLDEGKINQEAASLYATESFENQKKIYSILMDNFTMISL